MKLTDLKDLRVIKNNLSQEPEKAPVQKQPRKRSVELRSKEEHARNQGLLKGQKVRMMDTNDTATIVGFGKDFYELELDGLTIRAVRNEFIPINPEEDRKLRSAVPSRSSKKSVEEPLRIEDPLSDLTVDLHIKRIPGSDGIPEWAALDFQMNYFRQVLRQNLKHKGKRIVFIHGVGDGILAQAIRKELDEVFALSCSYTFGPMGATNVTIR